MYELTDGCGLFIMWQELYHNWVLTSHRTLMHILEDLPSVKPPIDHVCELMHKLQPRYYSISSSPKVHCSLLYYSV